MGLKMFSPIFNVILLLQNLFLFLMFVFWQKLMLFKAKCEGCASVFDLKNEGK